MEERKSKLQKRLEKFQKRLKEKGWKHLEDVFAERHPIFQKSMYSDQLDSIIQGEYLKKGYSEILVRDAFDEDGTPFRKSVRAIYVKD